MLEAIKKPIDVGTILCQRVPAVKRYPVLLRRLFIWALKNLADEDRINKFLQNNHYLKDYDFIDKIFDELKIDYSIQHDEIKNIPVVGRVLIVANHPLGGLDGLALLHLISTLRRDVFIVVNELLCIFSR